MISESVDGHLPRWHVAIDPTVDSALLRWEPAEKLSKLCQLMITVGLAVKQTVHSVETGRHCC